MSQNPYQSGPVSPPPQMRGPDPRSTVYAPGLALLIVAAISISCFVISIAFNVFLLVSGGVDQFDDPRNLGISKELQVGIRLGLGVLFLVLNCAVAYGAYNMMNMKSYSSARQACILAVIPCISPCYFLGIPFGIWGLVALGKPGVKEAFDS